MKVEYATPLTEQIGKVAAMVSTQSSIVKPSAIIVEMILDVSVDKILAFTPLPKPSASTIKLQENDIFVAMSDGCPHAGIGREYNFGWKREDIIDFLETIAPAGYTAKTYSTILIDECNRLYGGEPGDDATACVIKAS